MKTAIVFALIGLLILLTIWFRLPMNLSVSTVDIHIHDTKFVFAWMHLVFVAFLFLGTFFTLGGIIGTKFRGDFLIAFVIFLLIDISCVIYVANTLSKLK